MNSTTRTAYQVDAEALRRRRVLLGLTMEELAARIGCSKSLVSEVEHLRSDLGPGYRAAAERALELELGALLRDSSETASAEPVR